MPVFERLGLWLDPVPRPGPEAMAVDEWLLETAARPVLRVYGWSGGWGTFGYFGDACAAARAIPGLAWVRRWTGGGTVDHRNDWTYTVVAPAGEPLSALRGAESYQRVHAAVVAALVAEGVEARLSTGGDATGLAQCFQNPVHHDVVGNDGAKLAGAGQRRTKRGLLHQGSVAGRLDVQASRLRAECLARCLARHWQRVDFHPPPAAIAAMVSSRYASAAWTERLAPPSAP